MNVMERQTSVDDLLGGFWRLGQAGMGRTDSEAAFQEFLKRIPSTTNLAAAVAENAGATSSQPVASTSALPSVVLSDVVTSAAAAVGGIPRVPSLELLRQLVHYPGSASSVPAATAAPSIKAEALPGSTGASAFRVPEPADVLKATGVPPLPAPVALPAAPPLPAGYPLPGIPVLSDLASLAAVGGAALQGVPHFAASPSPLTAALTPAAAAAAALQLGQLGSLGARLTSNSTAAGVSSDKDMDRVDQRRARRMLSNRESARRSRRRKQEHLCKLEEERNVLEDERRDLEQQINTLERRTQSLEDENKRLKDENERLRDELRFLRTEISDRKDRSGYGHYGGRGRLHVDSDDELPAKRHRHSDKSSSEEHPGTTVSELETDKRSRNLVAAGVNGTHSTKHGAAINGRLGLGSGGGGAGFRERSGSGAGGAGSERGRADVGKVSRDGGRKLDRAAREARDDDDDDDD
ncbi:hypothetical protein VaNZ11_007103 [Volvox africanus]|uniref:BZIP domain-containing protein n=1 Tax=Volvox africanus TaxID=51714 RepID=A0ABQ5S2B3_9CHLO|nr:hypothetical protein VaNZ11_007103 [Volvox africanus]